MSNLSARAKKKNESKKNYNFPSAFRVSANLFIIQNRSKSSRSMRYIRYKGEHAATPTFHIHPRKTEEKKHKGGYLKGT